MDKPLTLEQLTYIEWTEYQKNIIRKSSIKQQIKQLNEELDEISIWFDDTHLMAHKRLMDDMMKG